MVTRRHTNRTSRKVEAEPAAAPEKQPQTSRSSRRSAAEEPTARRSSSRMSAETSGRRPSTRQDSSSGRQGSGGGREEIRAQKKKKQMFMNLGIVAAIIVVGFIIWQSLPNPNLPVAEAKLTNARILLDSFKKEVEDKSPAGARAVADEIEALLAVPMFANGINDPLCYEDPTFADIYYATEAKNVLDEVRKAMGEVPDIENELKVKANCDWLAAKISNIKNEENLDALIQSIADFRRNPINLQGDPDPIASTKYSRFIESINGKNQIVADEAARRQKLSDDERKAEEEARAKAEADRKAKEAEERKLTIAQARENADAERDALNKPDGQPDLPKGKDYAAMSNTQIYTEARGLAKELKFKQAKLVMAKMKEEAGFDVAAKTAELDAEILTLFGNARQEMSENFNDARQLERAEMLGDARKSIEKAVKHLDALLENCADETVKKELLELKPLYDKMFNKLWN